MAIKRKLTITLNKKDGKTQSVSIDNSIAASDVTTAGLAAFVDAYDVANDSIYSGFSKAIVTNSEDVLVYPKD